VYKLYWSFGEPRGVGHELVCDFYYQTGRHVELRLPWPAHSFAASGDLMIGIGNGGASILSGMEFSAGTADAGRKLYHLLGKDAQTSLIRAFTNLPDDGTERILCLQFVTPVEENRERCLALEDLPWELLHDGEDFISERYGLQIVRSYTRDLFFDQSRKLDISSWHVLLLSPFVFCNDEISQKSGLFPLPQGAEEIRAIRDLQNQTYGLVKVGPPFSQHGPEGITRFADLEKILLSPTAPNYHMIHFVGHGLIYDDEPCLCFEHSGGGVDYVSVQRMRKLFKSVRDTEYRELPSVLFLNACSSSSRGRYSSGYAAGLHDLGICVLGYKTEIPDDTVPLLAAKSFYQSLCVDQSLQTPYETPNVISAVGTARRALRKQKDVQKPLWGSMRAYIPTDLSFQVLGRGLIEKSVQSIYRFFSRSMNPADYTDHLSIGFFFALLFGTVLGMANLSFIFPEAVSSTYLTYLEILGELGRIFIVGPLSFLVAAILLAWQTHKNHQFLIPKQGKVPFGSLFFYTLRTLPISLGAGVLFTGLFAYSFASLELLTNQTAPFSNYASIPVEWFWWVFLCVNTLTLSLTVWISNWLYLKRKESLHSYRTYHVALFLFGLMGIGFLILSGATAQQSGFLRFSVWGLCTMSNTIAFALIFIKMLKEISWCAFKKRNRKAVLSWPKLIPLLGGTVLGLLFYFLLEESVRFEPVTIHQAIQERKQDVLDSTHNLQGIRIIERALKQRAISDIPESVRSVAEYDWLLSVVCADYSLFLTLQEADDKKSATYLREAQNYLKAAIKHSAEVEFRDYYCNIAAMVNILLAGISHQKGDRDTEVALLEEAVQYADLAVEKDSKNFAYLDTLALAEARLGVLQKNLDLLQRAAIHNRQAEWSAFFLRSNRANEVKHGISQMGVYIEEQIEKRIREKE